MVAVRRSDMTAFTLQTQVILPNDPADPLEIHGPAAMAQLRGDAAMAVAAEFSDDLTNLSHDGIV